MTVKFEPISVILKNHACKFIAQLYSTITK